MTIACRFRTPVIITTALVHVATLDAQTWLMDVERSMVTVRVPGSGSSGLHAVGHVIEAPLAEGSVDHLETEHRISLWSSTSTSFASSTRIGQQKSDRPSSSA